MAAHECSGGDPLAVAGAAAQRTSRLRHAIIAQVLAVLLLGAVVAWQPGRGTVLAGGSTGAGEEFVRVTVPPQSHPGDMLQVAVAGHREREIEVPQGAQPGQTLMFGVPVIAPAPAPASAARAPSPAVPATKAAAAHKDQEREVAEATRQAYRAAVGKASTLAEAADPAAAPAANSETGASSGETEGGGDDFGPLIAAIKQIIQSASSDDPNAKAQSQNALKAAVNSIVAAKIKAARAKDAAEAAAAKKAEDENVAKKLGRLLGEQKAAEEFQNLVLDSVTVDGTPLRSLVEGQMLNMKSNSVRNMVRQAIMQDATDPTQANISITIPEEEELYAMLSELQMNLEAHEQRVQEIVERFAGQYEDLNREVERELESAGEEFFQTVINPAGDFAKSIVDSAEVQMSLMKTKAAQNQSSNTYAYAGASVGAIGVIAALALLASSFSRSPWCP